MLVDRDQSETAKPWDTDFPSYFEAVDKLIGDALDLSIVNRDHDIRTRLNKYSEDLTQRTLELAELHRFFHRVIRASHEETYNDPQSDNSMIKSLREEHRLSRIRLLKSMIALLNDNKDILGPNTELLEQISKTLSDHEARANASDQMVPYFN